MKKKIIIPIATALIICAAVVVFNRTKPDWEGMVVRVAGPAELAGGSFAEGAARFSKKYGCTVEFTEDYENCDLFYSSGEDFSQCQPLDEYINLKKPNSSLRPERN